MATGKEIFHVDGRFLDYRFSPDGLYLVAIDSEALNVWDVFRSKQVLNRSWPDRYPFPVFSPMVFMPNRKALAMGMMDGNTFIWDLAPETWPSMKSTKDLTKRELDDSWLDITNDPPKAYMAIRTLVESPVHTIPFLKDHLKPAAEVNSKLVERILADLDSNQFATRDKAAKELAKLGDQIEPSLRKALEGQLSEEVRRQIKAILDAPRAVPSGEILRTLRAIQVLERIGTPEARDVLKKLAAGAVAARETREAQESLERLARKAK
jgi:hypothetical protein